MNFQESISHIEKQGWKVNKVGKHFTINRMGKGLNTNWRKLNEENSHLFSEAEVVRFASGFSTSNNQRTKIKKNLKQFSNGSERTHIRNMINSNDIEKLEELSLNSPTKQEDIWSWD